MNYSDKQNELLCMLVSGKSANELATEMQNKVARELLYINIVLFGSVIIMAIIKGF